MITRARIKELRSLATREGRREQGLFLAEGVRVLEEALRHQVLPRQVLFRPEGLGERGQELLQELRRRGVDCEPVEARDLERVAEARTPQGILGAVALPERSLPPDLPLPDQPRVAVLDGIQDPGNVGTLLRSALAFGFRQVVLTGSSADPHAPKVVRATAGAVFALHVLQEGNADTLCEWLVAQQMPLLVTSSRGSGTHSRLQELLGGQRLAVVIGSEAEGCAPVWERAADLCWRIPHEESVESLNAAVAGSILLQQAYAASR